MEKESFEDEVIGEYLNEHFICIKVDKEERPDIDSVYMGVCQAVTGSGGWPMTIIMTPEQKPFYAGTYFPKVRRYGQPGLTELLPAIVAQWRKNKGELEQSGRQVLDAVTQSGAAGMDKEIPGEEVLHRGFENLKKRFDHKYGGFGRAPKFPMPHNLMFLLRYYHMYHNKEALYMVEHTLEHMYKGGIFDHVGYGFSRYATDEKWLAPHFEKMLYDNALLAIIYLEAWQVTKKELYLSVVLKVLEFAASEMGTAEEGFYSALDADSEGEEGKYYTFSFQEIMTVLGPVKGEKFCRYFHLEENGNFEGKNIINRIKEPKIKPPESETHEMLLKLKAYRSSRFTLHRDEKILTSWNALMITAYAKAYQAVGDEEYLKQAEKAWHFINRELTDENGRLLISYCLKQAKGAGLLEDYSFFLWACLELYGACYQPEYLEKAMQLADIIVEYFEDEQGGYYLNPKDGEQLLYRPKEQYDGAMPSGNSVLAYAFFKLFQLTGELKWQQKGEQQMKFYAPLFQAQPDAASFALTALMLAILPTREVVCVLNKEEQVSDVVHKLAEDFHPQDGIVGKLAQTEGQLEELAPFLKEYKIAGKNAASFYLCRHNQCLPPVNTLEQLLELLKEKERKQ